MIKIILAAIVIIFSVPLIMMMMALEPALAARNPSHTELNNKAKLGILDAMTNGDY